MSSKTTYVLDTNVLVHDPEALIKFEEHNIVLPIEVIEELDGLKRGQGDIPHSVRQALRLIDSFREKGNISRGVPISDHGGTLRVVESGEVEGRLHPNSDNLIISVALRLDASGKDSVVLVSKDTSVRIKAEALGISAQDYKHDRTDVFAKYGQILDEAVPHRNGIHSLRFLSSDGQIYAVNGVGNDRTPVKFPSALGIKSRNDEQRCALFALALPSVSVVALTGKAGTGKTLLALAAGINQTADFRANHQHADRVGYEQVMVARPIVPLGNDLGFLPGQVEEKLGPWMQPIFDNLDVIVATPKDQSKDTRGSAVRYKSSDYLVESGMVKVEPLTYIRGRSLPRRFMIIDEAQNLRPLDVKTIITRCGEGTKIVFTGDLEQIDSPYLDKYSNGLSYLISKFINQPLFCYLNLTTSVRSELAELAATLL